MSRFILTTLFIGVSMVSAWDSTAQAPGAQPVGGEKRTTQFSVKEDDIVTERLRDEILTAPAINPVHSQNQRAAEALIRLINEESKPGGNGRVVGGAIDRLAAYPDSPNGIRALLQRIDYGSQKKINTWPIQGFPAARALLDIGVPARKHILGSLGKSVPEHKLHLMAYVLAELDQDDDMGFDTHVTVVRLMREIEQAKGLDIAPELEEERSTRIKNLNRMIALLLEPGFHAKPIPPVPRPRAGEQQSVGEENLHAQQHDQVGGGQTRAGSAPVLSDEERQRQFETDIKSITIKQMSVFHRMLTRNCIKKLPKECRVDYCGALRYDDGRLKHEVQGEEGYALLSWDIRDEDFVIFTVTLTLLRSADSITSFKSDGQELWVDVSFVHENQGVDKPLPRLGGRSVRDSLMQIHSQDRP